MNEKPLSNEELAELLGCMTFAQISNIPPAFKERSLPTLKQLMEIVRERLLQPVVQAAEVNEEGEIVLSRKQQLELASQVRKEVKGNPDKPGRDFIKGYEEYRFPKDFLRGTWETYKARGDERRIGCITVSLERFLPPDVNEPVHGALAGIGAVLNYLTHHSTWPMDVDDAHHIYWLIHQQLVGRAHENPGMMSGKNLMLVIGHPENMIDHIPHVDREYLLSFSEQMKEIDRQYPGWIIQSDPWDDN